MPLFCTLPHIIHRWSKWKVVDESDWMAHKTFRGVPVEGSVRRIGVVITQERTCKCCDFKQVKVTKARAMS